MVRKNGDTEETKTEEGKEENGEEGSVLGASLLFAGTAVGAGMLALPAETAGAGYVPSVSSLVACWAFTYVTSIIALEASWSVGRRSASAAGYGTAEGEGGAGAAAPAAAGFLSTSRQTLGPAAEVVTALLFWFLLTSIVVAYTSEGGELLSQAIAELTFASSTATSGVRIPPAVGSATFMAFFATLSIFGTERVDTVNRILVFGLVSSLLGLLGVGLPMVNYDNLLGRANWSEIYPAGISVGILSFGAQNVVPTLLRYLGGDAVRTRRAVLIGSLIPLVMYVLWEAVFLGAVPLDVDEGGSKMAVVAALGTAGGPIVQELVEVFSACAIGSSMAGASVSLVDFFQDAIGTTVGAGGWWGSNDIEEEEQKQQSRNEAGSNDGGALGGRVLAAALALGPPLGLACAYPDAFLGALENAGLIGGVSLYGLLPAACVISLRRGGGGSSPPGPAENPGDDDVAMPGRLAGGIPALYGIIAVSAALVVPEFVRLGGTMLR